MKKLILLFFLLVMVSTLVSSEMEVSEECTYDSNEFKRLEEVDLTSIPFITFFSIANNDYLLRETTSNEEINWYFRTVKGETFFLDEKPEDFSADYTMLVDTCTIQSLIENPDLFPRAYVGNKINIRTRHIGFTSFKIMFSRHLMLLYYLIK